MTPEENLYDMKETLGESTGAYSTVAKRPAEVK